MLRYLRYAYAFWALACFCFFFVLMMPFFLLVMQKQRWHHYTGLVNRVWARLVYFFMAMPIKIRYEAPLDKKRCYVFCANHNSYFDIPITGYAMPVFVRFMGKSSLTGVPLFGYMFRKLHIPVNRGSIKGSYRAFEKAKTCIDQGESILIFPEGGINEHTPPDLKRFKDGAFRMAIEKQVPVVPVTIPYNWIVLHDENLQMRWRPGLVQFHKPVETAGMSLQDVDKLKEQVREVIRSEMKRHFPEYFHAPARAVTESSAEKP